MTPPEIRGYAIVSASGRSANSRPVPARNLSRATVVSSGGAGVRAFVVPTNEEPKIAEQTAAVGLGQHAQTGC